jgi:ribonuclease-3
MNRPQHAIDIAALEQRIGHRFSRRDLALQALTHMSGTPGENGRLPSYQRLEFLGDRVLGLCVSAMLYAEFPHAAEGELSRRLANLVREERCAEVAAEWDLGPFIRLGAGESQSGGRRRPAILADVCEALIGAVFLDGGFEAAAAVVAAAWTERMRMPHRSLRDPKTLLQEWAQGLGRPPPLYREVERSGPAHAPQFVIAVGVLGFPPAEGRGASKRLGEQAAAEAFMARERVDNAAGEPFDGTGR